MVGVKNLIEGDDLLSPSRTLSVLHDNPDIPIFLACRGVDAATDEPDIERRTARFLAMLRSAESAGFRNRMLHPAALIDFGPPLELGTVMTYGVGGSGNSIVVVILSEILNNHWKDLIERARDWQKFILNSIKDYVFIVDGLLKRMADGLGVAPPVSAQVGVDRGYVAFSNPDTNRQTCLVNIPFFTFARRTLTGAHWLPDEGEEIWLRRMGVRNVVCLRNPLDIVASNIRKGFVAIDDPDYPVDSFDANIFARNITSDLAEVMRVSTNYHSIRYEDLLTNPVAGIIGLARSLGASCDEVAAVGLWQQFGMKQLPTSTPGHFQGGRIGDGLAYIQEKTPGLLDLLIKNGIGSVFTGFNYDAPDEVAAISKDVMVPSISTSRWFYENPSVISIMEVIRPDHGAGMTEALYRLASMVEKCNALRIISCGRAFPSMSLRLYPTREPDNMIVLSEI